MREFIMLSGVHGVGKGYLSNRIRNYLDIETFTASDLIKKLKYFESTDKKVKEISSNQDVLLQSIEKFVEDNTINILDGHLCLINNEDGISRIPQYVFKELNLRGIVCLYDDVNKIVEKLYKRDKKVYSVELIQTLQDEEIRYAKELSRELDIPLLLYSVDEDNDEVIHFIKEII